MKHGTVVTPAERHWLVIASADHVDRAVRDVEAFLAFQRARPSPTHDEHRRDVIGIWVDSTMVDAVPAVFDVRSATRHRRFRVRESVGVNGLWSLWWLDVELAGVSTAFQTVRESLIATLAAVQPSRDGDRVPRFVPVFGVEQHSSAIQIEVDRLRELFQSRIGEPVTWDSRTGALLRVSGPHNCDEP